MILRALIITICLLLSSNSVSASPITLYFTGVIQPGSSTSATFTNGGASPSIWDNQSFSGQMTFDPYATTFYTDNTSYFASISSDPTWLSISLNLPDGTVANGNNATTANDAMHIYRNYANPAGTNDINLYVQHETIQGGAVVQTLRFGIALMDVAGLNSTLFSDPNGGVSFTQPINPNGYPLVASSANPYYSSSNSFLYADSRGSTNGMFQLTSLGINPIIPNVPEPNSVELMMISLLAAMLIKIRSLSGKSTLWFQRS